MCHEMKIQDNDLMCQSYLCRLICKDFIQNAVCIVRKYGTFLFTKCFLSYDIDLVSIT